MKYWLLSVVFLSTSLFCSEQSRLFSVYLKNTKNTKEDTFFYQINQRLEGTLTDFEIKEYPTKSIAELFKGLTNTLHAKRKQMQWERQSAQRQWQKDQYTYKQHIIIAHQREESIRLFHYQNKIDKKCVFCLNNCWHIY